MGKVSEYFASLKWSWTWALIGSAALGLGFGFALRALWPEWTPLVIGIVGYFAGIVSIGTSNVFRKPSTKPYSETTQRVATCLAAFGLTAALVTLAPA